MRRTWGKERANGGTPRSPSNIHCAAGGNFRSDGHPKIDKKKVPLKEEVRPISDLPSLSTLPITAHYGMRTVQCSINSMEGGVPCFTSTEGVGVSCFTSIGRGSGGVPCIKRSNTVFISHSKQSAESEVDSAAVYGGCW